MRWLTAKLTLGLLLCTQVAAAAPAELKPVDLKALFEKHSLVSPQTLPSEKQFDEGFDEDRIFKMHSIHFSPDLKSAVFIRFDLRSKSVAAPVIAVQDGQIRFGNDAKGHLYFAYFMGFSSSETAKLADELQAEISHHVTSRPLPKSSPPAKHTLQMDWISHAEADETVCRSPPLETLGQQNLKNILTLSAHSSDGHFRALAMSCAISAKDGLIEGSGGFVVDLAKLEINLLKFEVELVTHPLQFAADLRNKWNSTGQFLVEFKKMIQSGQVFKYLSPETLTPVVCGLVAGMTPALLLTLASDGAAAPELVLAMKTALSNLLKIEKFLILLDRAAVAGEAALNSSFYVKLFKGAISEARLAAAEAFSQINELAFAKKLATCGI